MFFIFLKNVTEEKLKDDVLKLQEDKDKYQMAAKVYINLIFQIKFIVCIYTICAEIYCIFMQNVFKLKFYFLKTYAEFLLPYNVFLKKLKSHVKLFIEGTV